MEMTLQMLDEKLLPIQNANLILVQMAAYAIILTKLPII